MSATGCGTYDAAQFFTYPEPAFYALNFTAGTTSQCGNVTFGPSGNNGCPPPGPAPGDTFALIAAAQLTTSFEVPEPSTLVLFGSALIAFGALTRWRPLGNRQTKSV